MALPDRNCPRCHGFGIYSIPNPNGEDNAVLRRCNCHKSPSEQEARP